MKGLFWRVFAWYLGTAIVVLGLGVLVMMVTDPEFTFSRSVTVSHDAIESQAQAAAQAWTHGGAAGLAAHLARAPHPRFLFDDAGHELSGNAAPAAIDELVKRTLTSGAVELEIVPPDTFAGLKVKVAGKSFVFVRALARQRNFHLMPHPLPLWSRLLLGLLAAALICVAFARYVSSPLTQLRAVAREFAAGNLQVRVGTARPFNRGDEFEDLARDFDNMAAQIQKLVLTQQRLLGDISHELRSPLARLQLALEIARRKAGLNAEPMLNRIEQEAERLNSLIGQILRVARTEQLNPGARKLFDLANLVRDVAEDADFEASGKNRRVVVESGRPALVTGDRELLRSAIENVVRNAIRYTPESTAVTIDLRRGEGARTLITVRDQGTGVPENALPHLFEPFYRVNDARDRDSGGAGLGLAITQHVVAAHGGVVRATNCSGGGFEVQIELPTKLPEVASRSGIRFRAS